MHYYLYEIRNNLNGKIYIGVHRAASMDDGYMGSGKFIRRAIQKHGVMNFTKTVLETFASPDEMYQRESEVVDSNFISRVDTYNFAVGGSGGSIEKNRKPFSGHHTAETKEKISRANRGRVCSDETKAKIKANLWNTRSREKHRQDVIKAVSKPKSDAHKLKISEKMLGRVKEVVVCPHCEKSGGISIMHRWHFDKCKMRT